MAMHAPVVIVCLKPLANPDAVWPSLLDFGVILWSFCIFILVILYYPYRHCTWKDGLLVPCHW